MVRGSNSNTGTWIGVTSSLWANFLNPEFHPETQETYKGCKYQTTSYQALAS